MLPIVRTGENSIHAKENGVLYSAMNLTGTSFKHQSRTISKPVINTVRPKPTLTSIFDDEILPQRDDSNMLSEISKIAERLVSDIN